MYRHLLVAALLCGGAAKPAPRAYVTPNYGVRLVLPRGLSYCPLPDGWVGTDHGPNLFLTAPDCGQPAGPRIAVDYEHNVAEHDFGDGDDRAPRTDAELRRIKCQGARGPVVVLLGRAVTACVFREANQVTVDAMAVYALEPSDDGPGHTLSVALRTTVDRLAQDEAIWRKVVAGATLCKPRWAKRTPGRLPCQEFPGSWW